jgi:very-short-patch-repair endonuclease
MVGTGPSSSGAITAGQLAATGISEGRVRGLIRSGVIERADRGLFVIAGATGDRRQALWLALLRSGGGSFLYRRSAAALWGLDGVDDQGGDAIADEIEVAVPGSMHPRRGAVPRLTSIRPGDLSVVEGFPVTSVARTLVDLGSAADLAVVERALESGLRKRLTTLRSLDEITRHVRSEGARRLRSVLDLRPAQAPCTESDAETLFVLIVRSSGLPEPRRQYPVILRGRRYRLDFAWPPVRLAAEIDGTAVHGPDALEADLLRQNQILLDGWLVLRFTWHGVARDTTTVKRDLAAAWQLQTLVHPSRFGR